MEKKKAKPGKKNRKFGKNARYCQGYRLMDLEKKNKRRKMARQIRHFPEDMLTIKNFDILFGNGAARAVIDNRKPGIERRVLRRAQRRRLREQRKGPRAKAVA